VLRKSRLRRWRRVLVALAYLAAAPAGGEVLTAVGALPRSTARAAESPNPSALLFSERCSTCHNIGGGPKVGPDLLGVTKRRERSWFTRYVRTPAQLIESGDPIAGALYKQFAPVKMPDQPLTDAEMDGVWAYFGRCTELGGCLPVQSGPAWGLDASDEDVAHGRALFLGERTFKRQGAACFACHNVRGEGLMGGGTLGPDLTFVYARLGEKNLTPLLAEMKTPLMQAVYGHAALEEDEQFQLKGYFARLAKDGAFPHSDRDFFWLGLEGMGIVLGFFALWAGRPHGTSGDGKGGAA
jgi:mono/diheme cytochrome c family protein